MKYIKTYENSNSNYIEHPSSKYNRDKFFISPPLLQNVYGKTIKNIIIHVHEILIPKSNTKLIWPIGDNYNVYVDNKVELTGGFGWKYDEHDFNNINFMSAEKFYEQDEKLCLLLYTYVNKMSNVPMADWFMKEIKDCKKVLEKNLILLNTDKYNL